MFFFSDIIGLPVHVNFLMQMIHMNYQALISQKNKQNRKIY